MQIVLLLGVILNFSSLVSLKELYYIIHNETDSWNLISIDQSTWAHNIFTQLGPVVGELGTPPRVTGGNGRIYLAIKGEGFIIQNGRILFRSPLMYDSFFFSPKLGLLGIRGENCKDGNTSGCIVIVDLLSPNDLTPQKNLVNYSSNCNCNLYGEIIASNMIYFNLGGDDMSKDLNFGINLLTGELIKLPLNPEGYINVWYGFIRYSPTKNKFYYQKRFTGTPDCDLCCCTAFYDDNIFMGNMNVVGNPFSNYNALIFGWDVCDSSNQIIFLRPSYDFSFTTPQVGVFQLDSGTSSFFNSTFGYPPQLSDGLYFGSLACID